MPIAGLRPWLGQCYARDAVERTSRVPFQENVGPLTLSPASTPHHLLTLGRYVFDNYTWDKSPGDFSTFDGKKITARVPLTALLSGTPPFSALMRAAAILTTPSIPGPIAGNPFPSSASGSPAVIPEFFDEVCQVRAVLDRDEINGALGDASAATILQASRLAFFA